MRLSSSRFAVLLAALLAVAVGAPARLASADDPAAVPAAGSAVSRLTAAEAEFLRRRFPDWDQRDASERERLAENVLRLRSLSAAERARLMERIRRAEQAGLVGTGKLSDRVAWWREQGADGHRKAMQGHVATRAIAGGVVRSLPDGVRRAFQAKDGPGALSPLHRSAVESAIVSAWWRRATESVLAALPLDAKPAADAPPREAQEFVRLRDEVARRGAAAPPDLRKAYAGAVVRDRVGTALRTALGPAPAPAPEGPRGAPPPANPKEREAAVAALATALREAFPSVSERLARDVGQAAGNGPDALVQWAWQQEVATPRAPAARARRLAQVAESIERERDLLRESPELLRKAEELQAAILAELKTPEADVERLRAARSPFERLRVWREMKAKMFGARGGPGGRRAPPPPAMDGK